MVLDLNTREVSEDMTERSNRKGRVKGVETKEGKYEVGEEGSLKISRAR
jgi:hypothetical protein